MIDLSNETTIRLSKVPDWCKSQTGHKPNRSTVHRWRTRGSRGVKLATILIGGTRWTSVEQLELFFAKSTAAADGDRDAVAVGSPSPTAIRNAESFLDQEGL